MALAFFRMFPWRAGLKVAAISTGTLLLLGAIAFSLIRAATFSKHPNPQAILILDGSNYRILQAAAFARTHPHLPIWISGNCSERATVKTAFRQLAASRPVHYDLRATDTVTHFTTLASDLRAAHIRHVYLVTSDYHLNRAMVSANLVFGSQRIVFTPVSLQHKADVKEPQLKSVRDGLRSLLWLATGRTGARFNPRLRHLPGGFSCLSDFRDATVSSRSTSSVQSRYQKEQ